MPIGLLLGSSVLFTKAFDPIIQILRPISPLAWFPIGLGIFKGLDGAGLFTIAFCSMWPTVLNYRARASGPCRSDYLNVGRVLKLSRFQMLWKIIIPATLPYMFYRLPPQPRPRLARDCVASVEMLTGAPGLRRISLAGIQRAQLQTHCHMCA